MKNNEHLQTISDLNKLIYDKIELINELEQLTKVKEDNFEEQMEIEKDIQTISPNNIKLIKDTIKEDTTRGNIILSKEKNGGRKTNIYNCIKCKIIIKNDKEIIIQYTCAHGKKCDECDYTCYDEYELIGH